jgi:hypothetical protein
VSLHCEEDSALLVEDQEYGVTLFPTEEAGGAGDWAGHHRRRVRARSGALALSQRYLGEQEYIALVERITPTGFEPLGSARLYALDDVLFARRPWKGDFHLHSSCSDGKEPPAHVAAACRRIGLDFMALTDHRKHAPSLAAIAAFREIATDLRLFPGEEVHPPANPVHIVNFGGASSITDRFADGPAYRAEVARVAAGLPDIVDPTLRECVAACHWCFDQIRAGGGLAVFCHPYWLTGNRYDVPERLTTLLLDRQAYDALELIGGYYRHELESNVLQVARYHEERARGRRLPIVGASDAHGCERGELFGWYYTIVFAPTPGLPDIAAAVRGLWSVAVEALPGQTPRAHGPFRLAKYAAFLLREVFPPHDALCAQEARLLFAHLAGDAAAAARLTASKGQVDALYARLWAPTPPSLAAR